MIFYQHRSIYKIQTFFFKIECLATNSFEQFCINYSNEKLHEFCLNLILKSEYKIYRDEDLPVPEIRLPENEYIISKSRFFVIFFRSFYILVFTIRIETIEGLFALLDDEIKLSTHSDENFTQKVQSEWTNSPALLWSGKKQEFTIRHFARDVNYTAVNEYFELCYDYSF